MGISAACSTVSSFNSEFILEIGLSCKCKQTQGLIP
jgi:hypothetical protein